MFTLGENFIGPLMSFIHHGDLSGNTSWRYLCNYRATEKNKSDLWRSDYVDAAFPSAVIVGSPCELLWFIT